MEMGRNEMVVWYQSPYPEEYTTLPKIYICEFCLKYMKFSSVMKRHASKCVWKHPPGKTTISFKLIVTCSHFVAFRGRDLSQGQVVCV